MIIIPVPETNALFYKVFIQSSSISFMLVLNVLCCNCLAKTEYGLIFTKVKMFELLLLLEKLLLIQNLIVSGTYCPHVTTDYLNLYSIMNSMIGELPRPTCWLLHSQ